MEKEYRILLVEDSPEDAEINVREAKKALSPCRFLTVETRAAFTAALKDFGPDAVITDFTMPEFDGFSVIKIVQELSPFTPVLVVTGSINEETAVRCIKAGAADYILKNNVRRIGPSLLSALQQYDSRKRHYETQAALIESEEKYRALFENDPAGDFIAAADGVILTCNRAFTAALGFQAAEEAAGLNFFRFCPNPRQREDFLQILGGGRRVEHLAMDIVRNDGSAAFARVNAYGVFDDRHDLVRIVGFIIDETERRRLEERLAQAQKLESLGTLAGGIAHDFNNILNIILGYLSLLEKAGGDEAEAARLAGTIRQAAERGVALVSRLLTFARKDEPRFDPVRLSDVVDEAVKLARETFPKTIEIRSAVADSVPLVTADPDQLHQAFLNLLVNARDAMPAGGVLSVTGGSVDRRTLASRYPDTEGEAYSFIRVEDTGVGMDETVLKRIFEPFFTTKQRDSGTGLGLAMVYGIVKKHRGFVDVESEQGRGAAFTVYLPARTDRVRPAAAPVSGAAAPEGGGETILLVEDEETLREYLATVLRTKGYRVLEAADGEAAFDLLREHPGGVDVVLADFGLPKMDGGELFKRVHTTGKQARMVLMSGFLDPSVKPLLMKTGVTHFLQKPVKPEALLTTLREALEKKS
ncbi:MAG: response regulator [Spirochaetales bacterium]|nr:response regulator [Spirochaetales bacterium]